MKSVQSVVLVAIVAAASLASAEDPVTSPSQHIVSAISDPTLAGVLRDVLDRNPDIAVAEARTDAARAVPDQAAALPDPQAALTAFVLPPETRVGPQRATVSLSQRIPGGSKRKLQRQAAELTVDSSYADAEALRLQLITEGRRLYHEIAYLDRVVDILRSERGLLGHFEELAQARYASGAGNQHDVITVQAEITRIEVRLAEIAARCSGRVADLNALRDRPGAEITPSPTPPALPSGAIDWDELKQRALTRRPEMTALSASASRAVTEAELAGSRSTPDFLVGLTYGWVERRTDVDVADNGQDVFGITGGVTIPLWSGSISAAREEATQRQLVVEEQRRATVSTIDRQLEDLRGRLPEIGRQIELFEGVLEIQSEQSLSSAEAAYASGLADAISLLDAERTLLDVRLATERARADLAIALAELEGVIAGPLVQPEPFGEFEIRNSKFESDFASVTGPPSEHGGAS